MIDRENVIGNLEMNIRWITDHPAHQFPGWGNAVAAMTDALALLKEQESTIGGWISVKDKLPELNQWVLVYAVGKIDGFIGEHTIEICKRFIQHIFPSSPGHEIWSSPYQYFHTDYEITHWMPLPEPPKEEEENV